MILLEDVNADKIEHDNDSSISCQNLIDTMSNFGFVHILSRPTRM